MAEPSEDRVVRAFDRARLAKQTKMPLIVVYNNPEDYPNKYVARVWDVNRPTALVAVADTLEEIREAIPQDVSLILTFLYLLR